MNNIYELKNTENINTPCLIYYPEIIKKNTNRIIEMSGNINRLWPHVKSHKSIDMVRLLMESGIKKFKAATISEAEMLCMAGAEKVIMAYPLIGPNMQRLIDMSKAYPKTKVFGLEENLEQMEKLSELCIRNNFKMPLMIDVDMGMHRTGAPIDKLKQIYIEGSKFSGISLEGLHCYDGNRHENDYTERENKVKETDDKVQNIVNELKSEGFNCEYIVAGGTPSFPCHAKVTDWYLSPGTSFIHDAGYDMNFKDLKCTPAGILMTRVISHPDSGVFTLDLGYKAIAADPVVQRGYIVGYEDAECILQNEEHWVFRVKGNQRVPEIGECLYVIPTHICPTSALYSEILVAEDGMIVNKWNVTARNRKINY